MKFIRNEEDKSNWTKIENRHVKSQILRRNGYVKR